MCTHICCKNDKNLYFNTKNIRNNENCKFGVKGLLPPPPLCVIQRGRVQKGKKNLCLSERKII